MYLFRDTYKYYRVIFLLILVEILCDGILPVLGMYLPKIAIQVVLSNKKMYAILNLIITYSIVHIIIQCLKSIATQGRYPFQNNLRSVYTKVLFYKSMECDYSMIEKSEGRTKYEKANAAVSNGDNAASMQMLNEVVALLSNGITFLFIIGIIGKLNIYMNILLLVLTIVNYEVYQIACYKERKNHDTLSDLQKKYNYIQKVMTDSGSAKDIRLYQGYSRLLLHLRDSAYNQIVQIKKKNKKYYTIAQSIIYTSIIIRDGIAYIYCIYQVYNGQIEVSDFVLYMGAIASFSGWLNGIILNIINLKKQNFRFNDLREFYESTNELDPLQPLPFSLISQPTSIEFKNVSFGYDNSQVVLNDISFCVKQNESIALVGVNGSGKTTLIKLLCGFYKANKGEILINGYNINKFCRKDLFKLYTAVFQDMCIFPFTVRENVTLSTISKDAKPNIFKCLELAGIKEEIMKYDNGIESHMLKNLFADGIVLSGGQEQKLLLARAIYKEAPVLLLDEPTAALDPIAEAEVYNRFRTLTQNRTSIYISHRLASTRFCDKIYVLHEGKIQEIGTHEELMRKGGLYKNMYDVQSQYYK